MTTIGWRFQYSLTAPVLHDMEAGWLGNRHAPKRHFAVGITYGPFGVTIGSPVCTKDPEHAPPAPQCGCGLYAWTHRSPGNALGIKLMAGMYQGALFEVETNDPVPSWTRTFDEHRTCFRADKLRVRRVWVAREPMLGRPSWTKYVPFEVVPSLHAVALSRIPELEGA
ncbi:hypothetical protein [Kytococcus sedentarius]|uniref:hypothetical protein n=1 Tax=Kytococcus sedentarius TaxID=1276 RepID=UPI00384EB95E